MLLCSGDMFLPVQERSDFHRVALVLNECKRRENCLEALQGAARAVTEFFQFLHVGNDVTFVPSNEDRLDVGKVLVQGCSSDAGFFRDLRHRHYPRAVLGDQGGSRIDDGFPHTQSMRFYGLVPDLWHAQKDNRLLETVCLYL
jgi:hypothetical protein